MSFTNKTTHYELPQWTQNDIPTVLVDMNGAFSDIDTAIYNASVNGTEAKEVVETIQPTVTQLVTDVGNLSSDVLQNTASINTVNGKVTALQNQCGSEVLATKAQTLSGGVNELKNKIDSIPTSTVDTAMSSTSTNAVQNRVIKAYVDNVGADDISYDNTNTGLSATNVQSAIDELTLNLPIKVGFIVRDYGNPNTYGGMIACEEYGITFSDEVYRANVSLKLENLTVASTMPNSASGGSLTLTMSGTHTIKVIHNSFNITPATTFTDSYTISGWDSDGYLALEID